MRTCHQLGAHAVQGQAGLLLLALDGYLPNMRLLGGNPDRLGVTGIGLVTQYEGANPLGWQ